MGRGGFADKVAHGEEVAVRVGGEGRRRDYFGGEGAACCGGGDYLGGVLCGEVTAEVEEMWRLRFVIGGGGVELGLVELRGQCYVGLGHASEKL